MHEKITQAVRDRRGQNSTLPSWVDSENERQADLLAQLAALGTKFCDLTARRNSVMGGAHA